MYVRFVSVLSATALTVGCASMGQDFSMADVDAMQPGVTTFEQAQGVLGKPMGVSTSADGRIGATWIRTSAGLGAAASKSVGILFDKDGKMIRVITRSEMKTN